MRASLALLLSLLAADQGIAMQPDAARAEALQYLLVQDCGSCHGLRLKGGLGPSLEARALTGKPREFLIQTILEGRPGTAMPPWQGFLAPDEAAWLVDRLLTGKAVQ